MEYLCRVDELRALTPSVFELKFTPERPLVFEAGQYVSVVVPHGEKPLRRPYSVASAPHSVPIELCVQRIAEGPGNSYLARLQPGESFSVFAPYGFLVFHPKPGRDAVFIATGTGVAPIRSMLLSTQFQASPPRRTTCLLGVRTPDEILYHDEMSQLAGLRWIPCLSRVPSVPKGQFLGRVTQWLEQNSAEIAWAETDFYLCGNGAMIDEVKTLLKARGVPKDALYQEIYFKPPKA
ncbi:FAD-dependent oxidoreductase [bacterium]|nr:FAD-dependent oxidoreductase [bacterium]